MRKKNETGSYLTDSCKLTILLYQPPTCWGYNSGNWLSLIIMSFKEPFHAEVSVNFFLKIMLANLGTYKGIFVGPHCIESWGLILQKTKSKIWSQKLTSPSFQSPNVLEQTYFFLSRSWHFCCLIVCLQFLLLCSEFVKVDLIFYTDGTTHYCF